jgi:hypothetical protein
VRSLVLLVVGCLLAGALSLAQGVELARVFEDPGMGVSMRYPADWIYQKPSAYTAVFSGPRGTAAYYSTVTLQNVASTRLGGSVSSADEVVANLKCELASGSEEISIYDPGTWTWPLPSGEKLAGKGFTAELTKGGERYKIWYVVFPHPNGNVFCSFAYSSPPDQYDTFLGIARAMFDSWTFLGPSSQPGEQTPPPLSPESGLRVIFQAADHVYRLANSEAEFSLGKQDKRSYTVTVPAAGYLSCALIDERDQWIAVRSYDPSGSEFGGRAGTQSSIYGGIYPVAAGTYTVVVGPMKAFDDSDFQLYVYFSETKFTLEDLIAKFGDQYRVLP